MKVSVGNRWPSSFTIIRFRCNLFGVMAPANVSSRTKGDKVLEISFTIASAVPWIGGTVSNFLSGIAVNRRFGRVEEVLNGLVNELKGFRSEASKAYVKTEDFEELLEKTLWQAADERNEEKRRMYRDFLTGAIKDPGAPIEEQTRFLKTLDYLEVDHVRVLRALLADPSDAPVLGSIRRTLLRRVPGPSADRITEIVRELDGLSLTGDLSPRLVMVMTGRGSADLKSAIKPKGQQFLKFLGVH